MLLSGVTLLQREALEARPGAASTVKVEAVVCTALTARSEPYNRKAIHASRLNHALMRITSWIEDSDLNFGNITWATTAPKPMCLLISSVRATLPANTNRMAEEQAQP